MAIEENQGIPAFDASSFLSEENEVGSGQSFSQVENTAVDTAQDQVVDADERVQDDISFDDDFLEVSSAPKVDEEVEFNPEDYAVLSKTLGVEINTKEELEAVQAKFKSEEEPAKVTPRTSSSYNFNAEEQTKYSQLEEALTGANEATPDALMKWHLKQVNTSADYENNPEELDYHIETLKETGMFDSQEKSIREKIIQDISEQKQKLEQVSETRGNEARVSVNQELQKELKNYKDGFHGISVSPKDLLETFNSVRDGSVFEEIESNQANVAEMALLWKNKELFYKAFESPDPSVGVRKIMDELQNAKAKPAAGNKTLRNPHVFDPSAFLAAEDIKQVSDRH